MLHIKRLYTFILQTFLPLFMMTFFICLFIVLMQFLWKYVDDLVGKGLGIDVISELFFYASLTMVPLALPLAILLASLMVFGNLGERFELTAMKAAGVSLLRIMAPLIVCVAIVAVGAFFFQNDVLPKAQVKMWTLLYSMRQKSPELDIPEGTFYDQITGYNIYIKKKNHNNGMLYNMMIYDVSKGYGTANIIVSDSGKLSMTQDKKHLFLKLYQGEAFEDLKDGGGMLRGGMLYRRESFSTKEILIPFDANFNRMGDETMRNQYIGKNMAELQSTIDSVNVKIDSIGSDYGSQLKENPFFGIKKYTNKYENGVAHKIEDKPVILTKVINTDSIFNNSNFASARSVVSSARSKANRLKQEYEFKGYSMEDDLKTIRRHDIELQKKFTLAIACIIFFFIGAPLGSIIRKGGLAIPIVVSVLLFVVYYIIDNTGLKLAKEGIWEVWQGIWLSSAVLLPLGIFFTYKAVNDSAVFNADLYRNILLKIIGIQDIRHIEMKEIVMDDVENKLAVNKLNDLAAECKDFLSINAKPQSYINYWLNGYSKTRLNQLSENLESTVTYLCNSQDILVINKLMDYPILRRLFFYHPTNYKFVGWGAIILFPIGFTIFLIGKNQQDLLKRDINNIINVSNELIVLLDKGAVNNKK
ncbi:MAG: LptF/LptG family permease [Muribaculaceae bacterium]|nr:LptF/LptG family permease [Muribaculaceae bacterium]